MRRFLILTLFSLVAAACAPVQQEAISSRPTGIQSYASVGDTVLRVDIKEDLPNAFGRADIFGRTRNRGYSEIRYMGETSTGQLMFYRRDVDIETNEDTMNRTGFRTAVVTAHGIDRNRGVVAQGIGTSAPPPSINVVPPDATQFQLDLKQSHLLTLRDKRVEILDANPAGIHFVVE